MLRFLLYALRWQLSTPILWPIMHWLGAGFWAIAFANLVGASIFFFVDRFIFSSKVQEWEVMELGTCADCGKYTAVKRLRYDPRGYDRRDDPSPQFRCRECSAEKLRRTSVSLASFWPQLKKR